MTSLSWWNYSDILYEWHSCVLQVRMKKFTWFCLSLIVVALSPFSARALVEEWDGSCYERARTSAGERKGLGSCSAYDGIYGYKTRLMGIRFPAGRHIAASHEAGVPGLLVDGKPGFLVIVSGDAKSHDFRRMSFCLGRESSPLMTCFQPARGERR